jgi:pimeloyl-ACP methyl ester carboxylesterase
LSVTGEQDAWSPPDQHARIAQAIQGCLLRIVPSAGHMLPAEQPEPFNAVLGDWLAMPARETQTTK